jgi:hypothetical protein
MILVADALRDHEELQRAPPSSARRAHGAPRRLSGTVGDFWAFEVTR